MLKRGSWLVLGAAAGAAALVIVVVLVLWGTPSDLRAQTCGEPVPMRFEATGKITRSQVGFTQGLEFRDGQLYESTGRIGGTSRLNVISLTGQVKTLADQGNAVFGEGLTILKDEVFQLTWQDHQVFVYDLAGHLKRQMRNPRDGWGLTNDGRELIFSDGGPSFYYADPASFAIRKTVKVRMSGAGDIAGLNELELVRGRIYGNIFTTWSIVRLDPASGCIDGLADMRGLLNAMTAEERTQIESDGDNVLNGIAYDEKTGTFYVTGKRWKLIFTGKFSDVTR
ncbi:MAG: glutaminyl-peptide cyclotransferase [Alphaproteobacteria bacterium]|jgi:glutamine cyclotransferase|nr:glutaminyl-peptide cyclotransferase [Alphaproteobacteria bacterium]